MKTKAELGEQAEETPEARPGPHLGLRPLPSRTRGRQVSTVLRQFPVSGSLYGSPQTLIRRLKNSKQTAPTGRRWPQCVLTQLCVLQELPVLGETDLPGLLPQAWAPASGLGPAPQESHGQIGEPSPGTGESKWGGTGGPLSSVRNPSSWHTSHLGLGVSRIQRAPTALKAPQPWLPPTLWPPLTALLPAPPYSGEQAKVGEMLLGSCPHPHV